MIKKEQIIPLIIIMCATIITAADYEYTFEQSNFQKTENIPITYIENETLQITYEYPTLTGPNTLEFTETNTKNLTVTTTITNSTPPGIYNNSIILQDPDNNYTQIITFQYTILNQTTNTTNNTINTTNNTINTTNNTPVTIINISVPNGKIFGKDDPKPTIIIITYNGTIDYNKSNITLLHNQEEVNWIQLRYNTSGQFYFQIDQTPDGTYSGIWNITSIDNITTIYTYEYSIITQEPPKPIKITPTKGKYTSETITLDVEMNTTEYGLQWIITDGYPTATNSKWKSLTQTGTHYTEQINMQDADIGALYIKIIDIAGNYRIHPTGIISTPSFKIIPTKSKVNGYRNEQAYFEFQIKRKDPEKNLLRCKLENLIKDKSLSTQTIMNINTIAKIIYNDEEVPIKNEYDQTLNIGKNRESTIKLTINIPKEQQSGDYKGNIQCVIAK